MVEKTEKTRADSWREQILREFTPNVAKLTLVADPDGLLLEEKILRKIHERGFELVTFEDHIAFRYAYESRFRSRWDKGENTELVVVLHSVSKELNSLPYDLLRAGRQLSFNLGEIFPKLSYPVIASLDKGLLDAVYDAQKRISSEALGDNATKEFILRHVFEIAPELIKTVPDLLRVLLRKHYRKQRMPELLDDHLIRMPRDNEIFQDWPLENIIPDRKAFFGFLQERWPVFLDNHGFSDKKKAAEGTVDYELQFSGPSDVPFDHDDIRVYIDSLTL